MFLSPISCSCTSAYLLCYQHPCLCSPPPLLLLLLALLLLVELVAHLCLLSSCFFSVCAAPPPPPTFSCIPAPMLSGITKQPVDGAAAFWPGCTNGTAKLAWWGDKCGSGNQIQWAGVYAFDGNTGAVLPNCVKTRPAQATPSNDTAYWLGDCGQQPAAVPSMATQACTEPFTREFVQCRQQEQ